MRYLFMENFVCQLANMCWKQVVVVCLVMGVTRKLVAIKLLRFIILALIVMHRRSMHGFVIGSWYRYDIIYLIDSR